MARRNFYLANVELDRTRHVRFTSDENQMRYKLRQM